MKLINQEIMESTSGDLTSHNNPHSAFCSSFIFTIKKRVESNIHCRIVLEIPTQIIKTINMISFDQNKASSPVSGQSIPIPKQFIATIEVGR